MSGVGGLWRRIREQPPNVKGLGGASFFNDVSSEMIYPLLPAFLVRFLGASFPSIGLIEGAAESVNSLVKFAFGGFSDRIGRRKPLVLLGYAVASATRPVIALTTSVWQVLGLRATDRLGKGIRTAPRDALLAQSAAAESRGLAFGLQRGMDHAGAVVGPLLAGGLLLWVTHDLRHIFALSAIPAVATLLLIWKGVRELPVPEAPRGGPPAKRRPLAVLRSGPIRKALIVFFVFTLGNSTDAFLLLRAGDLGVATVALPFLWAAFHLSKSLSSLAGGDWADRLGPRRTIAAGWAIYVAVYAGFAVSTSVWQAWGLFLLYGLYFGLSEAPEKMMIARLGEAGRMGEMMGSYQLAVGIGALPASLLFGFLWERVGAEGAFLTGAAIAGLALVLLFALIPPDQEAAGV